MTSAAEKYPQVQEFLNYLKFEKRYSKHTILSYENDLLQFFTFVTDQYETPGLDKISSAIIRTWLAALKQDDNVAKTINRKIS